MSMKPRIALAIHWEGRGLEGLAYIGRLRRSALADVPVTHFISAAYFARGGDINTIIASMMPAFRPWDEVALLVHPWHSVRGPVHPTPHTVIAGEDPVLTVEYPGIRPQLDRGFTTTISAYPPEVIDAYISSSKLLLRPLLTRLMRDRGIPVERMLVGIRAGHGMASDDFLASAHRAGFVYDASAMDGVWARNAGTQSGISDASSGPSDDFQPLLGLWARLWGGDAQNARSTAPRRRPNQRMLDATSGAGITPATPPFCVHSDAGRSLLELPLTGGVIPPYSCAEVARTIRAAMSAAGHTSPVLSFAIRMETADEALDQLLTSEGLCSANLQWSTNIELLRPTQPAQNTAIPVVDGLSAWDSCRQHYAGRFAGFTTVPAAPRVTIPGLRTQS